MESEAVASVELVGGTHLHHSVVEAVSFALAVGVVRRAAVAHLTVALELRVAHLETVVEVPVAQVDDVLYPCVHAVGVHVVVITEAVAFCHLAAGVVEVVLEEFGILGIVSLRELVDVGPVGATKKVLDGLVVRSLGVVGTNACLKLDLVGELGVD